MYKGGTEDRSGGSERRFGLLESLCMVDLINRKGHQ